MNTTTTTASVPMIDFDSVAPTTVVSVVSTAPVVVARAVVVQETPTAFMAKSDTVWDWTDLRDYVAGEITKRFGAFPRDQRKEAGIFKAFLNRWGSQAVPIAKYAFEVEKGFWRSAPVSVNRFTINSDPYFAAVIVARLAKQQPIT